MCTSSILTSTSNCIARLVVLLTVVTLLPTFITVLEGGYVPYSYPNLPMPPPAPWYPPPPMPMKPKPRTLEVRYLGKGNVIRVGHGRDVELVCNFQGPDVKVISNIVWVKVKDPYHPKAKGMYYSYGDPMWYPKGYGGMKRYKRSGYGTGSTYGGGGYPSYSGMGGGYGGSNDMPGSGGSSYYPGSSSSYGGDTGMMSGSNYATDYYGYNGYRGYRDYGMPSDPYGYSHPYYHTYYSPMYYCYHCTYYPIGPNEPRHQVENYGPKSILRIRDVQAQDYGIYRCSATSQKSTKTGDTETVYQVIEFFN